MFGKTKEFNDTDEQLDHDLTIDAFFGDEAAVAESVRVDHLQQRVTQVEQRISSQFTSLAAYAQIAQEQVEMVRSEALHATERSEHKVIGLIERERADRIAGSNGGIDVTARLDALDEQITEIREGLQQCLSHQKALAEAITDLFGSGAAGPDVPGPTSHVSVDADPDADIQTTDAGTDPSEFGSFPPPLDTRPVVEGPQLLELDAVDGPIAGLSLT